MFDERLACALGCWNDAASQLCEIERVGAGLRDFDVAKGGGDAHEIDARMRHGKTECHRIVNAGVGVENDTVLERIRHKQVKQLPQDIRLRSA